MKNVTLSELKKAVKAFLFSEKIELNDWEENATLTAHTIKSETGIQDCTPHGECTQAK